MKDPSPTTTSPLSYIQVIESAQDLSAKLVSSREYEDMSYIGKLLYGESEIATTQHLLGELIAMQLDQISSHPLYSSYEQNLKNFMKYMTRLLNSTPIFTQMERPRGQSPNRAFFAFLQIQVLQYLFVSHRKTVEIYDNFMKLENLPLDQFVYDVFRFSCQHIMLRESTFERSKFIAFFFIKFPSILRLLEPKFKQQNAEQPIITSCKQMHQLHEVGAALNCDAYKLFLNQLLNRKLVDNMQYQQYIKFSASNDLKVEEANVIQEHLNALKRSEELLHNLKTAVDENKEKVAIELNAFMNTPELLTVLVTMIANESMDSLLKLLLRMNQASERVQEGVQDVQAEIRADIFNNSFILLCYIDTMFGEKVFISMEEEFPSSFFMIWRVKGTDPTSRKMFTQSVLDAMMDPISKNHAVNPHNAYWDEYCWSVGMIVKEMTQAHLRRHISTESLQKICEGFKNKRPTLCICALVWLCTQYKSMPTTERSRTVKILNLFKRPHAIAKQAQILSPILSRYSAELEADLSSNSSKAKTVTPIQTSSAATSLKELMKELVTPLSHTWITHDELGKLNTIKYNISDEDFVDILVNSVLDCGNEEDAKSYEYLCMVLILTDPITILETLLKSSLKKLFHSENNTNRLSDPQGLYLAKCIGKAFYVTLIIFHKEDTDLKPPTKMMKLSTRSVTDYERLVEAMNVFLQYSADILSTNVKNSVSMFITNFIEEIGMAKASLKYNLKLNKNTVSKCLNYLHRNTSRDVITMLCDLTSSDGINMAAKFFCK